MKKYTLNIGLNDKDTKEQIISTENAFQLVAAATMDLFPGATIYTARGIYKHGNGAIVYENTIIVELITEDTESVSYLISYAKKALNQESVLMQVTDINIMFI